MERQTGHLTPAAGRLLVAATSIADGIFDRSVVWLLEHDPAGTAGVILNKYAEYTLVEVLPEWADLVSQPNRVFNGGPVSTDGAICLAGTTAAEAPPGWNRVVGPIGLLHLDTPTGLVEGAFDDIRIFAGYAGWAPGQLESEIARGDWFVVDGEYADVFGEHPLDLWRRVLHRLAPPAAHYATWTPTPEQN
ncbi:YqgE/AlgH family protein [Granulicoccus phenolivorans]|uniref:YqgE/AlgH family protein n=1 Tax=Granulicoccus phenolivorans TaxID=266854 RepID=UPI0003F52A6D|nr:YqgE/AlgH family protein [Granulicoccus phenolivorans]